MLLMILDNNMRIYGNWCGPNWTAGQDKPASMITADDLNVKCIDKLDCGCKEHDIDCSKGGCSARGDRKLALVAFRVMNNPFENPITREIARLIFLGIGLASFTR